MWNWMCIVTVFTPDIIRYRWNWVFEAVTERNGSLWIHLHFFFAWNLYLFLFLLLFFHILHLLGRWTKQKWRATCFTVMQKAKTRETYLSLEKKEHQIGIRVQTGMTFANDFPLLNARRKRLPYPDFYCKYKFVSPCFDFRNIYYYCCQTHMWMTHSRTHNKVE